MDEKKPHNAPLNPKKMLQKTLERPPSAGLTGAEKRRHHRRPVLWRASLRYGDHVFLCQIRNISLKGAKIRLDLPLAKGAKLWLKMKDVADIEAEIVWVKQNTMGLDFCLSEAALKGAGLSKRLQDLGLAVSGADIRVPE